MISVYEIINKQRALTDDESKRLADLFKKKADSEKRARYVERNPEKIVEVQTRWRQSKGYKKAAKRYAKSDLADARQQRYRDANKVELARKARERYAIKKAAQEREDSVAAS